MGDFSCCEREPEVVEVAALNLLALKRVMITIAVFVALYFLGLLCCQKKRPNTCHKDHKKKTVLY